MHRPATPPRLLAALVAGLLVLLVGAVWFTPPALAEDAVIEVAHAEDGGLHPADVTIRAGETVTWRWTANEHHRIAFDDGLPESATRSGRPECRPGPPPLGHGNCTGHEFAVTFADPGTHAYRDTQGIDARGTVTVEPEPTPAPDSSPTQGQEPSGSDSPSPGPGGSDPGGSPSSPDSTAGTDAPDGDGSPEPSRPRRASSQSVRSGGAEGTSDAPSPQVATASPSDAPTEPDGTPDDEPTFEDFPEPTDPTPGVEDVPGEVAVGGDPGGGSARVVWGALGGATVLGTLGAFARVVGRGDPWSPA